MKRVALATSFALLVCCVAASPGDSPKRPRIFGIAYVRISATNMDKAKDFYSLVLKSVVTPTGSLVPCDWCERAPISGLVTVKRLGPIELDLIQAQSPESLLKEVAFTTDDAKKLRDFLLKQHVAAEKMTKCGDAPCFSILDPENHRLVFVQKVDSPGLDMPGAYSSPVATLAIIHAGFIVHERAAEDRFYKDILGFRLYWHGGMKDDETNWVDMQVPDGTDWIEYMLNVPANADHHTLGVMNHIALGVPDIKAAREQLLKNGWKLGEELKIGRDGKWQLNLYDPDGTRVELMEFTPVEKPCCSEYTGPHPAQKP